MNNTSVAIASVQLQRWATIRLNHCRLETEWRARFRFSPTRRNLSALPSLTLGEYVIGLDLEGGNFDISSRLPLEDFSHGVAIYLSSPDWGEGEVDSGAGVSGRFFQRFYSSEEENQGLSVGVFLDFPSRRICHFFFRGENGGMVRKTFK